MESILLIISGPAGSGKNTVCERLIASNPNIVRAITATTRPPRVGESDGIDYHFLTEDVFKKSIDNGDFYEWASVHGRYYGTQKSEILSKLSSGKDVILIIDVQGARTWKKVAEYDKNLKKVLHSVFIKPASLDTIAERMHLRGDSDEEIKKRLQTAERELQEEQFFEKTIISGTRDEDLVSLNQIYLNLKNQK